MAGKTASETVNPWTTNQTHILGSSHLAAAFIPSRTIIYS